MYRGLRLRRLRRARCRTDAVLCHIFEEFLPGLGFVGFVLLVSAVGWTGLFLSQFSGIDRSFLLTFFSKSLLKLQQTSSETESSIRSPGATWKFKFEGRTSAAEARRLWPGMAGYGTVTSPIETEMPLLEVICSRDSHVQSASKCVVFDRRSGIQI
jgi:hypothetical protein